MSRNPPTFKAAACLLAFLILSASTISGPPIRAADRLYDVPLSTGVYNGTFIFTIEKTYNKSTQEMPTNSYSLRAEDVMGTIRFRVTEDGTIPGISIRIPAFQYTADYSQVLIVPKNSQGTYNCTGGSGHAGGVATASGGSGSTAAPPLSGTPFDFYTKPVKFDPGDPWGRVSLTGKCPDKPDSKKYTEAVKVDFNAPRSTPFTFQVTSQGLQSASGTCSTDGWKTADRSISCYWAAYSNGYKRKTAPGP